jgi:hypothetical protein
MPSAASLRSALFGGAAVALGVAIADADGTLTPRSLGWLSAAVAAALLILPLSRARRERTSARGTSWLAVVLVAGLAYEIGFLFMTSPLMYGRLSLDDLRLFFRAIAAISVLFAAASFAPMGARRVLVPGLLIGHAMLGCWLLHASPRPHIDVFDFQRDSCNALLRGTNPYALTFANIYGDATAFYGPNLSVNGRLQFGFVYPPLSLLLALPGHLFGDFRYSQLAAIELSAAMMAFMDRRSAGTAAAALFLLTPRCFFVMEQGWTEPYLVLLLTTTVFVARHAPRALPYAVGLFLCVKQYLVFALLPVGLLLPWRDWGAMRAFVLKAALTAAVVTVPLALWSPRAFWFDVGVLQTLQPLRMDALSYLVWFTREHGAPPPMWVCFAVTGAVTALCLWRLPRTPAGFAGSIAIVFLAFFATNKQAFANYYFFVIGALCCAIAAQPVCRSLGHHGASRP